MDDNPDVVAIRIQSMAEICGADPKPQHTQDNTDPGKVFKWLRKGNRVFLVESDGTRWQLKAKRVKRK